MVRFSGIYSFNILLVCLFVFPLKFRHLEKVFPCIPFSVLRNTTPCVFIRTVFESWENVSLCGPTKTGK